MMYDELAKALRTCTDPDKYCEDCGFFDKCYKNTEHFSVVEQAADAIEELSARADAAEGMLAEQPPVWIPVTERLPEKHDRVLVYSKATRMGRSIDFINSDGNWYTTPKVTHWMPLPEPPDHIGDVTEMVEPPKDGEA